MTMIGITRRHAMIVIGGSALGAVAVPLRSRSGAAQSVDAMRIGFQRSSTLITWPTVLDLTGNCSRTEIRGMRSGPGRIRACRNDLHLLDL
jgi:hypothetical protein